MRNMVLEFWISGGGGGGEVPSRHLGVHSPLSACSDISRIAGAISLFFNFVIIGGV